MLQLPAELRLIIVRQLSREDKFSLLTVCKELKTFVHPLFYEHLLFTTLGFAFPHAPNAYPFLEIPNVHVRDPVSVEERENIMKRVRSITIARHNHNDCADWPKFQKQTSLAAKADVLTFELAEPSPNGIAECHERVWPPNCDICDEDPDHEYEHEDDGHPFPDCGFISSVGKSTAETIVIKNYPILSNGIRESSLFNMDDSASRFVVLLKPNYYKASDFRDMYDMYDSYGHHGDDGCPYGSLGTRKLLKMISSEVKDVTLVFMTNSPNVEWAPDCKHYDSHWYDGTYGDCSCCYDSEDWEMSAGKKRKKQNSCWQFSLLRQLAKGIAASKARFTIVNYSSIIPDGVERDKALRALKTGKRATVRKKFMRELHKAHQSQGEYEARLADVRFVSMKSWILSGAWENVFERKELGPWFDHIAKKKRAKKAAAKEKGKLAAVAEDKESAAVETVGLPQSTDTVIA